MLFVYGYHKIFNKIKETLQVWQNIYPQRPRHKERAVLSAFDGSMTVEAAIVLPVFLMVICGMVRFFVLISFQNILQTDMENVARHLGCIQYIEDNDSKISQTYAGLKIMSGKAANKADDVGIKGGMYGVSLLQSDISPDNEINTLAADYLWDTSLLPGSNGFYFHLVQKCSYIPWIGESIVKKDLEQTDDTVYITKNGSVCHKSKECTYLTRCIKNVRYGEIADIRNISGGRYKACERCVNKKFVNTDIVYITDYGDRYHSKKECNTLKRYIQEVKLSEVRNKRMCKKCS